MVFKLNIILVLFVILLPGLVFISPATLLSEDENKLEALIQKYEKKIVYDPYNKQIKQELSILYHNRAKELADDGLWEEAIDKEERSSALAPDEEVIKKTLAVYYNSYGLELKDRGNFSMAAKCFKAAIDYFPDEPILKKNAATIYLIWADNFMRKNEYDNAERMLVNVEQLDEDNPYIYVMRGEIAYSRDNYYRGRTNWNKALELNSSLYNVRIKLEKLKKDQETERNFSIKKPNLKSVNSRKKSLIYT